MITSAQWIYFIVVMLMAAFVLLEIYILKMM